MVKPTRWIRPRQPQPYCNHHGRRQMLGKLLLLAGILVGPPLLGVFLAGHPVDRYLEFPPQTRYVRHAPFSWIAFVCYGLLILAAVLPLALRAARIRIRPETNPAPRRPFPGWGWGCLATGLLFWVLAWNRFGWFKALQPHTFTPLWLSFILVVNALSVKRKGSCLVTDRREYFWLLFPLSAVFWWFFEYLNRFVQNWQYAGVSYGPGEYLLYATLSFSTVLPAVMSVREVLLTCPRLQQGFKTYIPINVFRSRKTAGFLLVLGGAGLGLTGIWPNHLFSLLWLAPLMVLVSLLAPAGKSPLLTELETGDWRSIVSSALAALICGWFWEMWNFYSLAKWQYNIPHVDRFRICEMPLLGYAGYLPFGLQCTVISELFATLLPQKPTTPGGNST